MCSGEISATCFSLRQPNRDRRNKKETNKLLTAIANQNLFYLWRVAGGDPFDCILAYLYIFAIQLANPTVNTIPSAQDDAKREKPFRSQRSIAFEDSSAAPTSETFGVPKNTLIFGERKSRGAICAVTNSNPPSGACFDASNGSPTG